MLLKLVEEIKRIQKQSTNLQNANKTIFEITAQTNILAMNAAIEAAHAGEAGKGFAVVAGEIRKLAELSSKESEGISAEIRKMEKGIAQITSVSNETVKSMDTIFTKIKTMDDSFAQVNNAVEEQASGGSQILNALQNIKSVTLQVRDGAETIHKQSGKIYEGMETLQQVSQNVIKRAGVVKDGSRDIATFLEEAKEFK
jgi:methyl-accepting chemotaxis protein